MQTAAAGEDIQVNHTGYETAKLIPVSLSSSWKTRALRVVLGDMLAHGGATEKSWRLRLALAEVAFHYFANVYQAMIHVEHILRSNKSIVAGQFVANLRRKIQLGMWSDREDSREILTLLRYQIMYTSFLDCIEQSCELTVKFWSALLAPRPLVAQLAEYGKQLYEKRYKLVDLANDMLKVSVNHTEFLIKYGLYMRLIFHDNFNATQIFRKIVWEMESMNSRLPEQSLISLRGDVKLMIIVVSLQRSDFFAILDANHEIEYQLGYELGALVGTPATRLMPSLIADLHQSFVQQFFRTMDSKTLGCNRFNFIRHSDSGLLACRIVKKVLPSLRTGGLQGVATFCEDPVMEPYTRRRGDQMRSEHVGAILCDSRGLILELTRGSLDLLGIGNEMGELLRSGIRVVALFPEVAQPEVERLAESEEGVVIAYSPERSEVAELKNFAEDNPDRAKSRTLIWVRTIREKYSTDELLVVVFSPIPRASLREYIRISQHDTSRSNLEVQGAGICTKGDGDAEDAAKPQVCGLRQQP